MTEQCCPTCGAKAEGVFAWSPEDRTFSTPRARIKFTETQAAIFAAVWNAGEGGVHDTRRFMQAVYGNRPDGGPDYFNVISVTLIRMRKLLKTTGYTITTNMGIPRQGWRLVKIVREDA